MTRIFVKIIQNMHHLPLKQFLTKFGFGFLLGDRQVRIASSCTFELYIDGESQDVTNNNKPDTVCKTSIDSGSHVIAVHSSCSDNTTDLHGFILEISGGLLATDGTFKCSANSEPGWYLASHDISSWRSALIVGQNDGKKFRRMPGIDMKANFVWSNGSGVKEVFCRAPPISKLIVLHLLLEICGAMLNHN